MLRENGAEVSFEDHDAYDPVIGAGEARLNAPHISAVQRLPEPPSA